MGWVTINGHPVLIGEDDQTGTMNEGEVMHAKEMIRSYVGPSMYSYEERVANLNQLANNDKLTQATQKYYQDKGVQELTLYRGLRTDANLAGEFTYENHADRQASSWTEDKGIAQRFGDGRAISASVPISQIVVSARSFPSAFTGIAHKEQEVIVKGSVNKCHLE